MKIEFEKIENDIEILESAVRKYPVAPEDEGYEETHFQTRLKSEQINEDDSITCSFSYYDSNDNFLGLDSGSIWAGDITLKSPYSISFHINPPSEAASVKCQIGVRKHQKSVWDYGWKILTILVFTLLISAIVNLWL